MANDQVMNVGKLAVLGAPATSTYSSSVATTHAFWCSSAPTAPQGAAMFDLGNLATGKEHSRGFRLLNYDSPIVLRGPVDEYNLPILMALALGNDTVSTLTATRQHVAGHAAIDAELLTTSIDVYHTTPSSLVGAFTYDGCFLNSLTIRASDGGYWEYEAEFITNGYANQMFGVGTPTYTPTEPIWFYGGTQVVLSTTAPTAVTGDPGTALATVANIGGGTGNGWTNVDLSGAMKSLAIRIRNNGKAYFGGSIDGKASKVRRGRQVVEIDLSMAMDPNISTIYGMMNTHGSTAVGNGKFGLAIRKIHNVSAGTYNYGFADYFPRVMLAQRPTMPDNVDRESDINVTFRACDPERTSGATAVSYPHFWNTQNIDYA